MTEGKILHVPEKPHVCLAPKLEPFGPKMATGTVWECGACSRVWVLKWVPPRPVGSGHQPSHHQWEPESHRERRKRLGLHWWQRGGT